MQQTGTSSLKYPKTDKTISDIQASHASKNSLYLSHSSIIEGITLNSEESKQSSDDMSQSYNYDWKDWLNEIINTANLKSDILKRYKEILAKEIYVARDKLMRAIYNKAEERLNSLNGYFSKKEAHVDTSKPVEPKQIHKWINFIKNQLNKGAQDLSTAENVEILSDLVISDEFSKEKSEWIDWCKKTKKDTNDLKKDIEDYWNNYPIFDSDDMSKLLYEATNFEIHDGMTPFNFDLCK